MILARAWRCEVCRTGLATGCCTATGAAVGAGGGAAIGAGTEFQANHETLQDMKPGDQIEAKLREAPKC
jgi:hypothetical protein